MLFKFCYWKSVASIIFYSDFQSTVIIVLFLPRFAPYMEAVWPSASLPGFALRI